MISHLFLLGHIQRTPCCRKAGREHQDRDDGHEDTQGTFNDEKQLPVVETSILDLKYAVGDEACKRSSNRIHAGKET